VARSAIGAKAQRGVGNLLVIIRQLEITLTKSKLLTISGFVGIGKTDADEKYSYDFKAITNLSVINH
jgi:hypothetical protein